MVFASVLLMQCAQKSEADKSIELLKKKIELITDSAKNINYEKAIQIARYCDSINKVATEKNCNYLFETDNNLIRQNKEMLIKQLQYSANQLSNLAYDINKNNINDSLSKTYVNEELMALEKLENYVNNKSKHYRVLINDFNSKLSH